MLPPCFRAPWNCRSIETQARGTHTHTYTAYTHAYIYILDGYTPGAGSEAQVAGDALQDGRHCSKDK